MTRIRSRYIEALENGNYDGIPAPVFVRGFLRSYAVYLGLDPEPLIAELDRVEGKEPSQAPKTPRASALAHSVAVTEAPNRLRLLYIAGGAVIALVVAIWLWGLVMGIRDGSNDGVEKPRSDHAAATSSTSTSTTTTVVRRSLSLAVKGRGRSWLEVYVDGDNRFKGFLEDGEDRGPWKASSEIRIIAGKAEFVEVIKDGESAGTMTESQQTFVVAEEPLPAKPRGP